MALPAVRFEDISMDEHDRIAIAVLEENAKNTGANLVKLESKVDVLDGKIDGLKDSVSDLRVEVASVRTDMEKGFAALRVDMGKGLTGLRVDMEKGFADLQVDTEKGFAAVTDKNSAAMGEMRRENSSNFKWLLSVFGAGVVALAAFMYFLFSRIPVIVTEVKQESQVSAPVPAISMEKKPEDEKSTLAEKK